MLIPAKGRVIVKVYLRSKAEAEAVQKRSGLLIPTQKDNKHTFEGVPNEGFIYALPDDYSGPLKLGQHVVFDEDSPKGFKWQGETMFALKTDQIAAIIEDSKP